MLISFDDVQINYEMEGPPGAPVVAFSHSLAAATGMWDLQTRELRQTHRVLLLDTRGHGRSSAPVGPYSMEMLARDVVRTLDHLKIDRAHFVGLSMGGMIGQVLGIRYPDRLQKLVLCDTTSRVPPEAAPVWEERIHTAETQGMEALAPDTLARWLSENFRREHPEITESILGMIVDTPVAGYAGCSRAISNFDVSGELSRIKAPTLVIVGENDPGMPMEEAERITSQIAGAEMAVMPGALHLSNIEAAELFNRELLKFLGR